MASLPFAPVFVGLDQQIAIHGRFRGDEIALIQDSEQVTWRQYNERANRVARILIRLGVRRGDRVASVLENTIWAHEVLLGVWRAGAVMVPLSPLLSDTTLGTMLTDCEPKLFLVDDANLERSRQVARGVKTIGETEFASLISVVDGGDTDIVNGPHDPAVIIYSSGTTGTPKGIAHCHESRLKFAAYFAAEFRFTSHARTVSCVPIHSNGAWLSWAAAKWMGATTVVLSRFDPGAFLKIVETYQPTHGFLAPSMAHSLLGHERIETVGLRCFQTLITAGSPMPDVMKRELQRLTDHGLYELWGLTEGVATIMTPEDMKSRLGSVGRPMLGCDIRLIDGEGKDVTGRSVGEIVGRSAQMMSGYWNRRDANEEIHWIDETGIRFIRTGDVGEFSEDGFLTLRGRLKDMIISGGLNVYPVDIEAVLLQHPKISDVAVAGVMHPKWGEVPVAFVRLKFGAAVAGTDLMEWANAQLSKHQRVKHLYLIAGDFPRNSMGKVIKRDLLKEHCGMDAQS